MTPRYGYSATCGRGTAAKVTEQPTVVLPGPNTITADLVGPTTKVNRRLRAHSATTSQVTCRSCSQSATATKSSAYNWCEKTMGRCSKLHTRSELANVGRKTVHEKIKEKRHRERERTRP